MIEEQARSQFFLAQSSKICFDPENSMAKSPVTIPDVKTKTAKNFGFLINALGIKEINCFACSSCSIISCQKSKREVEFHLRNTRVFVFEFIHQEILQKDPHQGNGLWNSCELTLLQLTPL